MRPEQQKTVGSSPGFSLACDPGDNTASLPNKESVYA